MGLRFRKSMNLGPLRINFSKSGVGYSYGVKGYRVTHTADGKVRTTVSVPGTGVSHVTQVSEAQYRRQQERKRRERQERSGMSPGIRWALTGLFVFLVVIAIAGCSADEPEFETPSMSVQEAIAMVEGTRAPTEPTSEPIPEPDPEPAPKPEPTEPKTEPKTEPATEPKTEPAPVPEATEDSSAVEPEPKTEPTAEPATQPPTEPATEAKTEPAPAPTTAPEPEPKPQPTEPVQQTVAYIGNKSSKKLHHTWCGSVDTMSAKNKVEFSSRDAAIGLGYEPCKNCTP